MDKRPLLPPFPGGWFALGLSRDLPPGGLRLLQFMGQEVVLFRTREGVACAMDAYCPHLGAHMGHGGTVDGETLRCPFHGFCFDVKGACVSNAYGTRPPPKARARVWPVREVHGVILAFHDPAEQPPDWVVPDLDMRGWSPLLVKEWGLCGHPQETSENSVDIGHLSVVHGYSDVQTLRDAEVAGPYMTVRYAMRRPAGLFGWRGLPVRAEFDIHVHGLGYSLVEVTVPKYGLRTRQFVLATPTERDHITLRIALSLAEDTRPARVHPLLGLMPRGWANDLLARAVFDGFAHDVQQDFVIWQHKRYVQPPILAEGDGPVGKYRLWARQFYRGADLAVV